jgi:molecular chaperone GrpE
VNDDAINASFDEPLVTNGPASSNGASADELAAAKAKADENYNKFLYAMADFENYKKRVERQLADISLAGKKSVLKKFLPVLDNLERALTYDPGSEGLRGGLQATLRGFESVLESEGVKGVSLKGAPFDPKLAEAIGTQPAPQGVADDTVLEEAARAYLIGEDVLRPGQVIVAKSNP